MRRLLRASPVVLGLFAFGNACSSRQADDHAPNVGQVSQAESDSFLFGSGRDGSLTSTGPVAVNIYAAVTSAVAVGGTSFTVDDPTGFAAGHVIMVWQTVGLAATDAPSGSGTSLDLTSKPVGQYELARIQSISVATKTITLTNPVINAYAATGAQIIRVPEYTNVTISSGGIITPGQNWDGKRGGVIAFLATGTVQNDGSINADGGGLRGGVLENAPTTFGCSALDGFTTAGGGGHKGEGLVISAYGTTKTASPSTIYGRGNVSVGAGGGDCHNSGGGGGGHAAAGGGGALSYTGDTPASRAVGGMGGAPITYTPSQKLAFGGGGGAGEENDSVGGAGGAGGGVVWIRANTLTRTTTLAGTISANGTRGATASNDGAGGGGAGGIIYVQLASTADCMGMSVNGGNGGSTAAGHGPGGGGAGGYIVVNAAAGGTCTSGKLSSTPGTPGTDGKTSRSAASGGTSTPSSGGAASGGTCDPRTGKCGGCIDDTWCPGQHCQLATHACVNCTLDSQCASSQWCKTDTGTCTTKLSNGVPIPTVPYHTPPLTGACATGVGAAVCAAGVCDSDGECGLKSGDGPCSSGTVCRSGLCSKSGVCIDSGTCLVDTDCASGNWCDIAIKTCEPKLSNGIAMPSDTGHTTPVLNGKCNGTAAALVCTSGVCDGADDKCGYANGDGNCTASSTDTRCRSGVCGSDGKCGLADGDGTCSSATASVVCRSGTCGASGKCITAGTCLSDADCTTAGFWCMESTKTCTPTLSNGTVVPTDAPHTAPKLDGTCGTGVGALVCTSGICDPTDNKCGLATGDKTCVSNGECRSGHCKVATGTCVQCASDSDCTSAQYCDATGTCQARLPDGSPCTAPDMCISARCSGGTCGGVVISDAGDAGDAAEAAVDAGSDAASDVASDVASEAASDAASEASPATDAATDTGSGDDGGTDAPAATDATPEASDDAAPASDAAVTDASIAPEASPIEGTVEGGGIDCSVGTPGRSRQVGAVAALSLLGLLGARRRRRA